MCASLVSRPSMGLLMRARAFVIRTSGHRGTMALKCVIFCSCYPRSVTQKPVPAAERRLSVVVCRSNNLGSNVSIVSSTNLEISRDLRCGAIRPWLPAAPGSLSAARLDPINFTNAAHPSQSSASVTTVFRASLLRIIISSRERAARRACVPNRRHFCIKVGLPRDERVLLSNALPRCSEPHRA